MKKSFLTNCNGQKISIRIGSTSYLEDFKADQATSRALALYQSEFVIRSDGALIELLDLFLESSETFRALIGSHNSFNIFATLRFLAIKLRNPLFFLH